MPTVKPAAPSFVQRLSDALVEGLKIAGIEAKVQTEPVPHTRLHRVLVVASKFRQLRPSERQDLVWRIVSQDLSPEEQLRISMILTATPDELVGRAPRTARRKCALALR